MVSPSLAAERRLELKVRTADLIAADRRGTGRDDDFHRGMRRRVEAGMQALCDSLRSINRLLDAFYG